MTAFLAAQGLSGTASALFRSASALAGFVGTQIGDSMISRLGLLRTGVYALVSQSAFLVAASAIYFAALQGDPARLATAVAGAVAGAVSGKWAALLGSHPWASTTASPPCLRLERCRLRGRGPVGPARALHLGGGGRRGRLVGIRVRGHQPRPDPLLRADCAFADRPVDVRHGQRPDLPGKGQAFSPPAGDLACGRGADEIPPRSLAECRPSEDQRDRERL